MKLSAREVQILDLLSHGLTNKAIAQQLGISPHTVRDRIGAMCIRFHVKGRTALVAVYLHKTAAHALHPHAEPAHQRLKQKENEHPP